MYENGVGVIRKDLQKAKLLYQKAAKQGNQQAIEKIQEFFS
jgi:TPR repeat protein